MASIKKRGDNTYQITVSNGYDRNGKKLSEFKTVTLDPDMTAKQQEKEIARIAAKFEDDVKSGRHLDQTITFEGFVMRWLIDHGETQLRIKTLSSYRSELESKILPAIGHIKMSKLQPLHLIKFYEKLKEDGVRLDGRPGSYSTRTIKYCHQIISSVLQSAVHWQVLSDNVAKRVKPPKGAATEKKNNYFDEKQAITFLRYVENAPLKYRVLMHIAIYGGLRLEETLPLMWQDIDFVNRTININKVLVYVNRKQHIEDDAKNISSTRRITIPRHVIELLREQRAQVDDERVFDMHYSTPGHWLRKTIDRYNATHEEKLPRISFHGLRHTNATLLISEGLDIRTVSGRLGHRDASTTLNIYSHYIKSRDEAASDALEGLLNHKTENLPTICLLPTVKTRKKRTK
ncbi:MAG: site-specific integrase [Defluviitaleaceae bacterium]|nr:site-specific integrase [Defluviitaleaceae bacterium]